MELDNAADGDGLQRVLCTNPAPSNHTQQQALIVRGCDIVDMSAVDLMPLRFPPVPCIYNQKPETRQGEPIRD